ncbi:retention module-containing protein [Billgrantia sulfidoxydans]|uniref:Retention module-containing protein n=1 Tax=Billgrantia sulfidoxydans TaxID=2733484 RepID=A0ABX7W4J7_9GAMM|nr:retention module-containing protein [Halomonas sulfidoxydans]QTP55296.1 retention module-containing protein [Halomonas sulfidoxydans]
MAISTVISITGQAWARDAEGNLRELRVGDTLQEGEVLITSDNGSVQLDFADGIGPVLVEGGEQVVMTAELDAAEATDASEFSALDEDLEALLTALDDDSVDLLEVLDATAAGAGPGGGADGGHSFVRLARIAENVDPLTFNFGMNDLRGSPEEDGLAFALAEPDENAPDDSEPTITIMSDSSSVDEAGLPTGSVGDGSHTTSGTFAIDTGNDGLQSLVINGENVTGGGTVNGTHGTLVVTLANGSYSWTYTLDGATDGDTTSDSFTLVVTDSDGDEASDSLTIAIIDDVPQAVDDAATQETENAPVTINVFGNDTGGADGIDLTNGVALVAGSLTGSGTLVYNEDGTFTYTPTAGEEGVVSFEYTITDADGDESTATVTLTLQDDSEPTIKVSGPDVNDGQASVDEAGLPSGSANDGSHATSGTLAIDTGNDGLQSLVINGENVTGGGTVNGTHGTLVVTLANGSYSWTYTLDGATDGDTTSDSFTLVVTDSDGDEANDSLTIAIIDDVPQAVDDTAGTAEDTPITYNVMDNDTAGADGATLTAASLRNPSQGSLSFDANGAVTFTPAAGFEGDAVIDYTITDADGDTSSATLTVTVADDSEPTIEVGGPDVNDGQASVDEAGLPSGSANDGSHVTSGTLAIDTGNDGLQSLVINGENVTGGGTVNGTHGTLVVTLANGSYSWTYTLDGATDGDTTSDSFTLVVTDSDGDEASDSLTIAIIDDVPQAVDDAATQETENAPVTINVFGNDTGGADGIDLTNGVALVAGSLTGSGTLVYNEDGTFTYTPAAGEEGGVSFEYTITDADGDESTATVTLTLQDDSEPTIKVSGPDVNDGQASVDEAGLPSGSANDGSHATSGTLAIDTGNDGLQSLVINGENVTGGGTVNGTHGTLVVTLANGSYSWTYTLDDATDGDTTSDSFTLVVTDSDGDEANDSLTIAIIDDVPQAVDDTAGTAEDTPITYNVMDNDTAGADGATLTAASLRNPSQGSLSFDANGAVTFTPAAGFEGDAVIDYTITDADGDTSSATLTVTVADDSEPTIEVGGPDVNDGQASVDEAGLPSGSANDGSHVTSGTLAIDTGNDGLQSLVINGENVTGGGTVNGTHGTLVVTLANGSYSWTYTLDGATDGDTTSDSFTLVVTDSDGDEANDSLTIAIIDDVPQAVDDAATQETENAPVTINVFGNDTGGADGIDLTNGVALVAGSLTGSGTLVYNEDGTFTYTPAAGEEGGVSFDYTITDADGDESTATVTLTLQDDSEPTIEVGGPDVNDGQASVDEAGLPGGSANDGSHVTSGTLAIDTGNDGLQSLVINGENVTGGGTVQGTHGTLVVTLVNGSYSWTYTLDGATDEHSTQGPNIDGVKDSFALVVTDSDGDSANASLTIDIVDDIPSEFTPDAAALVDGAAGKLNFADAVGADGLGNVVFKASLEGQPAVDTDGNALSFEGQPLFYALSSDGQQLTAMTESGEEAFVVTLKPNGDGFTIQVNDQVLNGTLVEGNIAAGISGGNSGYYALNSEDGDIANDVLISSTTNDTINTSSGRLGVSEGQSITNGEFIRFDFLQGLSFTGVSGSPEWEARQQATQFTQDVYLTGGKNSTASFIVKAVADAEASSGHPSDVTDQYLTLSPDDIVVLDGNGVDVTSEVTLTQVGDGIRIDGVKDGWSYRVETEEPFEAIEVTGANGDNFKLGDLSFQTGGTASDFDIELKIEGQDADGDTVDSSITLSSPAPDALYVGNNSENNHDSTSGSDVLIGDAGGKFTIVEPGQNYNISLIVDASGSMNDYSGTGYLSRMDLTKQALVNLANQLKEHDGTVNVQLMVFSYHASTLASIQNLNADNVNDLLLAIDAVSAGGGTNYESAFEQAVAWFNAQHGNDASVSDGFKNLTYFLTDGDPTKYYDADGNLRGPGDATDINTFNASVEAFEELSAVSAVHATGIGSGVSEHILKFFDNSEVAGEGYLTASNGATTVTAPFGYVDIVNTAEDLDAALKGGSSSDELAELGDDVLTGGDGDDIIFGDAINSDHLEWTNLDTGEIFSDGSHDGLGYAGLVEYLRWAEGTPGEAPSDAEIIAYVKSRWEELVDTQRADGGNDFLDGGSGDDVLIGGAGDDVLIGGAGDDALIGGAGDDTLLGGLGADTFAWKLGDQGEEGSAAVDTVEDFSLAQGDSLDLSELLSDGNGLEHLRFEADGSGTTKLYISTEGNFGTDEGNFDNALADQVIVLENFSGDLEALKSSLNID